MLVLSRKEGESVLISVPAGPGAAIVVKAVRVGGGRVRLAFDAPREVEIRRAELAEKE